MKRRTLFFSLVIISAAGAYGQQQAQPVAPPPTLPPGVNQRNQLSPETRRPRLQPPGLQQPLLMTNQFGVVTTNQFGLMTNEFGVVTNGMGALLTNQFGAFTNAFDNLTNQIGALATNGFGTVSNFGALSNQFGLPTNAFGFGSNNFGFGTNRFGFGSNGFGFGTNFGPPPPTGFGTNRIFGTNSFGGTNQAGFNFQDQAVSQFDRTLLVRIRARVLPVLHTTAPWDPVHFVLNEGNVTLTGFIVDIRERELVLNSVQGVPGVANVVDNLQLVSQDMAMTDADRALLAQIRQAVPMQPIPTATSAPLFFVLQQGVVGVVGSVPSVPEGNRIILLVRQTPGVTQVFPALTIGGAFATMPATTPATGR